MHTLIATSIAATQHGKVYAAVAVLGFVLAAIYENTVSFIVYGGIANTLVFSAVAYVVLVVRHLVFKPLLKLSPNKMPWEKSEECRGEED